MEKNKIVLGMLLSTGLLLASPLHAQETQNAEGQKVESTQPEVKKEVKKHEMKKHVKKHEVKKEVKKTEEELSKEKEASLPK